MKATMMLTTAVVAFKEAMQGGFGGDGCGTNSSSGGG